MTIEEYMQRIGEIYAKRGYLVIAHRNGFPDLTPGQIVMDVYISPIGGSCQQPVRVTSLTDFDDFRQQAIFLNGRDQYPNAEYERFYRVESD